MLSGVTQTMDRLSSLGVDIAFTVIDAGYCTITNMKGLYKRRVSHIRRLKPICTCTKASSKTTAPIWNQRSI